MNYYAVHHKKRPLRFPTSPYEVNPKSHDITKKFNTLKILVVDEITELTNLFDIITFWKNIITFISNSPNNQKWDTQGQYQLPGQAIIRDNNNKPIFKKNNVLITIDQYAFYEGKVVRAGFLSNYLYGYASAHAFNDPLLMSIAADIIGFEITIDQKTFEVKTDNPEDKKAYIQGWNDYFKESNERYYLEKIYTTP